jgi:hypothetical protein
MSIYHMSPEELNEYLADVEADELEHLESLAPTTLRSLDHDAYGGTVDRIPLSRR